MRTSLRYVVVATAAAVLTWAAGQVYSRRIPGLAPAAEAAPQIKPAGNASPATPPTPLQAPGNQDALEISPDEQVNIQVYQRANRSVVNITTHGVQEDDFFLFSTPREGSGSGSVLDKQGHILTNYHVIEDARQVQATLFDGETHPARLVGSDPNNDLAVLKIEAPAEKLFPLSWGDSGKLLVGLRVYAIGNPFGLERTLTTGIVSSLNRSLRSENNRLIRGIIQTDAAINPGNSGGPLLNRRGELVGITAAIVGRAKQSSGVGLAIPSNTAHRIVDELIRYGRVIRPDCGVFSVYEAEQGLLIARLVREGPAERAGLRGPQVVSYERGGYLFRGVDRSKADLIVAIDGRPVKTLDDLLSYVESKKVGERVLFTVVREGKKLDVWVELAQSLE
jgi:S1-C subfamily serine protease